MAADPVKATNAFLDRLIHITHWQSKPVGVDAQAVQISHHPERYPPNTTLARQLVGLFWAAAAAAAPPTPAPHVSAPAAGTGGPPRTVAPQTICPGGGGAGTIVGPTGNNIAGTTTTIPAGLVISGSAKAQTAVRYALRQLGKPYVFGAAGPDTFDCSGLIMAAWAAAGIALPHNAASQANTGTPEPTDLSQAVAGHIDRTDGRHLYLIQAPMTGVPVELTEATEWKGQIVDVRHRVIASLL